MKNDNINNKKYFDHTQYNYILKLIEEQKINSAIMAFEKYHEEFPYDLRATTTYASLLMNDGNIETAKEILEQAIITTKAKNINKYDLIKAKLKLLCCEGKYQEAYDYLQENNILLRRKDKEYDKCLIFLKVKLGLPIQLNKNDPLYQQYTISQMISYSEEYALEHIRKHIGDYSNSEKSCFSSDFPLEEIFNKLRIILPLTDYRRMYSGIGKNLYIFKYDNNGRYCTRVNDYIRVITIQDTNDILTMYPSENKGDLPYIDLDIEKEEEITELPKVKRMSQIDKFNQRYGKKVDNN